MSTESLAAMSLSELRHERQLAKVQLVNIKVQMRGTSLKERMEMEEAFNEAKEYIAIIEARIARLERVGRN